MAASKRVSTLRRSLQHLALHLMLLVGCSAASFANARQSRSCTAGPCPSTITSHIELASAASYNNNVVDATKRRTSSSVSMLMLRGGGGDIVLRSMGVVSKESLAKVCASWILANGFLLTVAPKMGIRLYGTPLSKDPIKVDPIMVYLSEVIGMTLLGQGVMFYLSTVASMQVHRAIGFGLSVRFAYLLLSFATGRFRQFKIKRQFLSIYTGFMTWTIFQLLSGWGKPKLEARIFASIAFVRSLDIHLRPIKAADKFFGLDLDVSGAEKSKIFMSVLGQSFLSSAVFVGALAFGVQPITAAGFYCLAWCLLGIKMGFWDQSYKTLGKNPWYQLITLGPSLLFAVGFLVP